MKPKTAKPVFCLFLLIAILVLSPAGRLTDLEAAAASNDLSVDQILDRIENRYTDSTFSADFIQKSTLKAMDITDQASGKVYIKYPGMMRWEYEKPDRQIIITDADKLWIYRPDDNQVMTGRAPAFFRDGKGASFLSDIRLVRQKFDISVQPGGQEQSDPFYHLMLSPREETMDITGIRLTVSRQTFNVIQVMTVNHYGDETRIDLLNFAFGVALNDSLFSFRIPEGVDVLQLDE